MGTMTSNLPVLVLSAVVFLSSFSVTFAQADWSQGGQQGWGQGGQQKQYQQLQQCKSRCVSQGQSPQQCQQRCIQQLSSSGSLAFEPYGLFDAVVDQGSTGQEGQQQEFQQCQRRCLSQGQSARQCLQSCMQQISGGGSGGQGIGPYGLLDVEMNQGGWGQGGQQQQQQQIQQQLQQCQRRCISQGQSPHQCQQRCIQQLSGRSGSGMFPPYGQLDDLENQGLPGQGGQQQQIQQELQQCQRRCLSQGQSPHQCQQRCIQQLSGGGGGGSFPPYGQFDDLENQGSGGQQQLQQLQHCQRRCVSQGQSPLQCQQRCIQQLSGGGSGGSFPPYGQLDFLENQGPWSQGGQQQVLQQCQQLCQSRTQSLAQQLKCISGCMQEMQQGSSGEGGFMTFDDLDVVVDSSSKGGKKQQKQQQQQYRQCMEMCQSHEGQSRFQCEQQCEQQMQQGGTGGGGFIAQVVDDINPTGAGSQYQQCQQSCQRQQGQSRVQCERRCQQQSQQGGRVSRWMVGFFLEE